MASGCSYTGCAEGDLTDACSRVDVSAVLPSKDKLKKLKGSLLVTWESSGDARFHPVCWDLLIKAARTRKKTKKGIILIQTERAMLKEASETAERHDSEEEIRDKAVVVAKLIKAAKSCVCFTGAGISTSAGIGDYRGKSGKWTMEDKSSVDVESMAAQEAAAAGPSPSKRRRFSTQESTEEDGADAGDEEGVPYEQLRPTYTHESLVKLMELGHLQYVISQNGDGLHTLSDTDLESCMVELLSFSTIASTTDTGMQGIPLEKIAELHGNVFLEKCEKCATPYVRPFYVLDDHASQYYEELEDNGKTDIRKPKNAKRCELCGLSHRTGRKCTKKGCKGFLKDSIINFRDNLEDVIYEGAVGAAEASDLMLCLGTTLQVTPANELVEMGKRPLRLVICNRQKTPLDKDCTMKDSKTKAELGCRVFGDCDRLMRRVMSHILTPRQLRDWEGARPERMEAYNTQRQPSE